MKPQRFYLGGLGIGATLLVAAGAITILFRPALAGLGHPRTVSQSEPPGKVRSVSQQPAPLPPDFLDLCRAAGV